MTNLFQVRLANLGGRACLLSDDDRCWDVEWESSGRFSSDPMRVLADWDAFRDWAPQANFGTPMGYDPAALDACVPEPGQVFAVGLNYIDHAAESGHKVPKYPMIFTKFRSCLTGPCSDVTLPSRAVDWEVELVAVIGRTARSVSPADAMDHVAGFCVGQDISERRVQLSGEPAQFSLGKSFPGFGPIGPAVVALDAIADVDDLGIRCSVSGVQRQSASTRQLIFPVPELVAYLSSICTLSPGDLIFTGSPSGVGGSMQPPVFLQDGDVIVSEIDGLGTLRNRCVAAEDRNPR